MDSTKMQDSLETIAKGMMESLLRQVPTPDRIVFIKKTVGLVAEINIDYYFPDGTSKWEIEDVASSGVVENLHEACYSPGVGSWFTAKITV